MVFTSKWSETDERHYDNITKQYPSFCQGVKTSTVLFSFPPCQQQIKESYSTNHGFELRTCEAKQGWRKVWVDVFYSSIGTTEAYQPSNISVAPSTSEKSGACGLFYKCKIYNLTRSLND